MADEQAFAVPESGVRPIAPGEVFLRHPAHVLAFGFGSGLSPMAPGTAGTLWAWASFVVIDAFVPRGFWPWLLMVGLVVGIWACEKTGRALRQPDHGAMVWDEILAFWLVLACLPHPEDPEVAWATQGMPIGVLQLLAFGLFRGFDILKPPPIRWVDRRWKGGWGVMADDLVAAAFTLMAVAVLLRIWWWLA